MKKLIFGLLILHLHIPTFSGEPFIFYRNKVKPKPRPAQELFDPVVFQLDSMPDLRLEHLEKVLHPIQKHETEDTILFFGPCKTGSGQREITIRAFLDKATGKIKADECQIQRIHGYGQIVLGRSPYEAYPEETYNALQALYEKQQEEKREQGGQENKEEEDQETCV